MREPAEVTAELASQVTACWQRVSNAGGAVGFPFPPVSAAVVAAATEGLVTSLSSSRWLLTASIDQRLAGWLVLQANEDGLTRHWATVSRVQTDIGYRGQGVASALLDTAADEAGRRGIEQLRIAVRGGQGLERFYTGRGWTEVGRWPGALRLGPDDNRDEVLMVRGL